MQFYYISEHYNKFLQQYEKAYRGFTRVPNIKYSDRSKFAFGIVLQVNGFDYYVSVSSFVKKQDANILIIVPGDENEIKGSLRFNYMIPVPPQCVTPVNIEEIEDLKYRLLVQKEYRFCADNIAPICVKANKIYDLVKSNHRPPLTENSCAFSILEEGCREYISKYINE